MLTAQQQRAVDDFAAQRNVRVRAVPGAGKTRVLVDACRRFSDGLCIILAYNHDLCEETKKKLQAAELSDRVMCYTFHGLCCACLAPAYDDQQLLDAIDEAERGALPVEKRLHVRGVLIDEAQDFRRTFLRLMRLVLVPDPSTVFMVVGDTRQMLYDYDDEDPAELTYLEEPERHFAWSTFPWASVEFTISHRLTTEAAALVSRMFDCRVESAGHASTPHPIVVRTMNMWKAGSYLLDVVTRACGVELEDVVVLVEKRRGNAPLCATINYLNERGMSVYVHGLDGADARVRHRKLCFSSWHASKGTERRVVVVLGLRGDCKRNPSFVALTRSCEQLYVVQDEQMVHPELLRALAQLPAGAVRVDEATRRLLPEYADAETVAHVENRAPRPRQKLRALDAWRPSGSGRWMRDHIVSEHVRGAPPAPADAASAARDDGDDGVVALPGRNFEDVSGLYLAACLLRLEHERTGRVKVVEDMLQPTRLAYEKKQAHIVDGNDARTVSPNVPERALLPSDLAKLLREAVERAAKTGRDWVTIAAAASAWNSYHHSMRQRVPFDWVDEDVVERGFAAAAGGCAGGDGDAAPEFDTVVHRQLPDGQVVHARCHALSPTSVYHFVWADEIQPAHLNEAAVRAALAARAAVVVNAKTGATQRLWLHDADALMQRICA